MSRHYASLKDALRAAIPGRRDAFLRVKKTYADKPLATLSVGSALGGMRGSPVLYWESSRVDPDKGVTFHGKTIEECRRVLPHAAAAATDRLSEPLPESMFWFLLTGEVPSQQQVAGFSRHLAENAGLPGYVVKTLDSLPATLHPMAQLAVGISALSHDSVFARAYARGIPKHDYWEYVFDDSLALLAKLPLMIGRIYQNTYKADRLAGAHDTLGTVSLDKDWSHNLAAALGFTADGSSKNINSLSPAQSADFVNLVRLYCALHGDHEGGNVSSHATHLVGSALSDPFLAYSAGVQGLAGPLHGLAAQEVVRFILQMKKDLGVEDVSALKSNASLDRQIADYLWSTLNSGRVIPGYGHAVLRRPDPRFAAMLDFGLSRPSIADTDPNFNLVHKLSQVAPKVLAEHGKTKNPFPNVDSSSGILFYHYGLKETLFFTVIFAGSRALGPLSQLVWDRILGLPIERPKSLDLRGIVERANNFK